MRSPMADGWWPMVKGVVVAALLVCGALRAYGDPGARELLERTRQLNETTRKWNDRIQRLQLRIVDRRGGERNRDVVIYLKKFPEDRSRTVLFFESPPEVKGVGFLQWADPHAADEQWLYLPELKRVRKISAGAKHESFVGTDFSYDDLAIIGQITDWTDSDARTSVVRDDTVDGAHCRVIEFVPVGKDVTYGKILMWLTDDLVIVKFEMYDKSGRLEKILSLSDIRKLGEISTPFRLEMQDVRSGSHTIVTLAEVKYDTGMADTLFTERSLERGL
jgi:outer membrane lipoprotein-sorting protein